MLMALQVELSEEPRGADGDERRAGGVRPEVRREPVEGGPGEVVRDDEGIRVDKQRVLLQDVRNVLQHHPTPREPSERTKRTKRPNETKVAGVREGGEGTYVDLSSALDTVIELGEPAGRLDGLGAADALDLEEEVVPDVLGCDVVWIEDGKVADAGQDEVLQRRGRRRRAADHEQTRGLERRLACRCPEPVGGCGSVVRLYSVDFVEESGYWAGGRGDRARRGAYRNWRSYFCVFASGGPLMHPISIYLSHTHHEQYARLHRNRHPCEWQTALGSKCYHYRKRLPRRRTARLHDQERKTSHFIHDYKVSKPISNM